MSMAIERNSTNFNSEKDVGAGGGTSGPPPDPPQPPCASCRELHADIRLSVDEIAQKLDSFFFRLETLIQNNANSINLISPGLTNGSPGLTNGQPMSTIRNLKQANGCGGAGRMDGMQEVQDKINGDSHVMNGQLSLLDNARASTQVLDRLKSQ